jgi:hypothetical protein
MKVRCHFVAIKNVKTKRHRKNKKQKQIENLDARKWEDVGKWLPRRNAGFTIRIGALFRRIQ